jgi:hypothetical protein
MGGAETWLIALLRLWARQGVNAPAVDFLATSGNRAVFDDEAAQLGARIYYVRYGRRDVVRFVREFRRILRLGQYDVVHDHQDYTSGWHFLMGLGNLPPVRITHIHNPAYQILNNYGVTPGRRITARNAHHRHVPTGHFRVRFRRATIPPYPEGGAPLRNRPCSF